MNATLKEDLTWLYSLENMGIKLGLSNVRSLLKQLGDPQTASGPYMSPVPTEKGRYPP